MQSSEDLRLRCKAGPQNTCITTARSAYWRQVPGSFHLQLNQNPCMRAGPKPASLPHSPGNSHTHYSLRATAGDPSLLPKKSSWYLNLLNSLISWDLVLLNWTSLPPLWGLDYARKIKVPPDIQNFCLPAVSNQGSWQTLVPHSNI